MSEEIEQVESSAYDYLTDGCRPQNRLLHHRLVASLVGGQFVVVPCTIDLRADYKSTAIVRLALWESQYSRVRRDYYFVGRNSSQYFETNMQWNMGANMGQYWCRRKSRQELTIGQNEFSFIHRAERLRGRALTNDDLCVHDDDSSDIDGQIELVDLVLRNYGQQYATMDRNYFKPYSDDDLYVKPLIRRYEGARLVIVTTEPAYIYGKIKSMLPADREDEIFLVAT